MPEYASRVQASNDCGSRAAAPALRTVRSVNAPDVTARSSAESARVDVAPESRNNSIAQGGTPRSDRSAAIIVGVRTGEDRVDIASSGLRWADTFGAAAYPNGDAMANASAAYDALTSTPLTRPV
jgi:hypothetical protein